VKPVARFELQRATGLSGLNQTWKVVVSRWKSPQAAAKHAQHAGKEVAQSRREKRKGRWMLIGVAVASLSLLIADYSWLKSRAQKRREEHQQRQHHRSQTNSPAAHVAMPQPPSVSTPTNHE
jgi:hypothetical protein